MAQPDPDSRAFRQMRHEVDDVYRLLTETQQMVESGREAIGAVWSGQRRHGTRLEEIQQSMDLQNQRLERLEDTQRQQGDRLGRVEGRLGGVEGRLDGADGRLEGVDGRLGRIEDAQQQQSGQLAEILTLLRGSSSS